MKIVFAVMASVVLGYPFESRGMTDESQLWKEGVVIPKGTHRENIYQFHDRTEWLKYRREGLLHGTQYPVKVTGLLIPYRPFKNFLSSRSSTSSSLSSRQQSSTKNPFNFNEFPKIDRALLGAFKDEESFYQWLGLNPYQDHIEKPVHNQEKEFSLGATLIDRHNTQGLTFSCFVCHSSQLFGKTIVGLTNKKPRANHLFHLAQYTIPKISDEIYQKYTGATDDEILMFAETRENLKSVGGVMPQILGLDTSLAQVALSLSKRNADDYATKNTVFEKTPRPHPLETMVVDSKPMVWWNVKYKNRWLSDGSVVSGNPIFTNILWNEIGRGADLYVLEKWLDDNVEIVKELTTAVFATRAPHWTEFFPNGSLNLEKVKQGQKFFRESCKGCHGDYIKNYELKDFANQPNSGSEQAIFQTAQVIYHEQTPVKDVGTDPNRYLGMKTFSESLNQLALSKKMLTKIVPQVGYVPPPLVGIWARFPYFHNNSIPNLCALMMPPDMRPKSFQLLPVHKESHREQHFDEACVGYKVFYRKHHTPDAPLYNTAKNGMKNSGHYKMFLTKDGKEKYTWEEKMAIIEFLKTL